MIPLGPMVCFCGKREKVRPILPDGALGEQKEACAECLPNYLKGRAMVMEAHARAQARMAAPAPAPMIWNPALQRIEAAGAAALGAARECGAERVFDAAYFALRGAFNAAFRLEEAGAGDHLRVTVVGWQKRISDGAGILPKNDDLETRARMWSFAERKCLDAWNACREYRGLPPLPPIPPLPPTIAQLSKDPLWRFNGDGWTSGLARAHGFHGDDKETAPAPASAGARPIPPAPRGAEITFLPSTKKAWAVRPILASDAMAEIADGEWADLIDEYRSTNFPSKVARREWKAEKLPCYLWSGRFKRRERAGLVAHSGLVCLDFDNLPNAAATRDDLRRVEGCKGAFVSPTGDGVKAIMDAGCPRDADEDAHGEAWSRVAAEVGAALGIPIGAKSGPSIDPTGKDSSRACFVSFDPGAWWNGGEDDAASSRAGKRAARKAVDEARSRLRDAERARRAAKRAGQEEEARAAVDAARADLDAAIAAMKEE